MIDKLRNIYLIGMSGAGKSTVGKLLANTLEWAFVDVNETIEAIYGQKLSAIYETFGEESFKNMEATILQELSQGEHQVFACHCDSVLDIKKFQVMKRSGLTVWLEAPTHALLERLEQMESPGIPPGESLQNLERILKDRELYYQQADLRINTEELSPESTTEHILRVIRQIG